MAALAILVGGGCRACSIEKSRQKDARELETVAALVDEGTCCNAVASTAMRCSNGQLAPTAMWCRNFLSQCLVWCNDVV